MRVADLPSGRDPADVWRDDPARLIAAVENAAPFLQFRVDRLLASADLASLEGRARAGEAAAEVVASHPSDLVRDQYAMQLAGRLQIDVDRMREAVARSTTRRDRRARRLRRAPVRRWRGTRRRPNRIRRRVRRNRPVVRPRPWIAASSTCCAGPCTNPRWSPTGSKPRCSTIRRARGAFELLAEASTFQEALERSSGEVRELLERLAVEEPDAGEDDDRVTISSRLVVNMVEPRTGELIAKMLDRGDERSGDVKRRARSFAPCTRFR